MKRRAAILALLLVFFISGLIPVSARAAGVYTIYVNRGSNIVNVVRRSTGKVVKAMYCSTGKNYNTPRGTFYTGEKYRWRALFGGHWGQYCTRITGHILFHSVPAVAYSKSAVPTREFNKLGTRASMGCVRLACGDAYWIYRHCRSGTKVVIGESKKLKKPKYSKVKVSTKRKNNWDPTDPAAGNPYRPTLKLNSKGKKDIEYGETFDIKTLVTVKSRVTRKELLLKHVTCSGKVNTKKPGKYKVKVRVKDPRTGLSRTKTFTFTVGKKPAQKA